MPPTLGGFRPSYNVQFATSTHSQIIIGVDVSNLDSDLGQLTPMLDQVRRATPARYYTFKLKVTFCVRRVFPLAANIYLNEVDRAFDAIRCKTAEGPP